jgi:hypothetical protein
MFNHLTYLIGSQCVLVDNVDANLRQLSYGIIVAKSYGRYDINGFHFHSTVFEASHPLAATANTRVVMRDVDVEGHESKYYGIIKNIIKYTFAGNKNIKIVFFDCDWFDPNRGTRENQFGIVEVKHAHWLRCCDPFVLANQVEQVYSMTYPCKKAKCVVGGV